MGVHPLAAAFASAADAYERARPSYAPEAIDWLVARTGLGADRGVVDLGAGTGKLTRALVATGARVVAVEPVHEMRAKLVEALPDVEALEGTAEAMPVAVGSADVVAVGQAFHWFRHEEALPEIARVLKTDAWLALLWNTRDARHPVQHGIEGLLRAYHAPDTPLAREFAWRDALQASPLFAPFEKHTVSNPQFLTRDGLRDRIASASFVAAMPEAEREALLGRVVALVEGLAEPFPFPYVTEVYLARRVPSNEGS